MKHDLILGTAGHIDHGKTALVKALTGVDTDRLSEEKRRGITIELGFAELVLGDYLLGIVDVPGHERFVRNMLAGATGIDLALLVVAADDSVKPQTREHLEILKFLELDAGVIALTKCDLPDPEWIDLVEQEVRELVAETFLAEAPLVRTSVVTGAGLDELRAALGEAAARAAASPRQSRRAGPFRMPIDRTFTVAGHGTVVTGSVSSGCVRVGDELVIEPGGMAVRVRSLQNHARAVDEVHRGQRAAINLAGVHHEQLHRGHELASPGYLSPSRRLTVRIALLPAASRPLKHRSRVRLHVGTVESMAAVLLLEGGELVPGQEGFAQLLLAEPAATTWNQPFVLRSESPITTVGGGHVLDPDALPLRRNAADRIPQLASLSSGDGLERASAAALLLGWRGWQPGDLVRTAGVTEVAEVYRPLIERGDVVELPLSPGKVLRVHRTLLEETATRGELLLKRMHEQEPLRTHLDASRLVARLAHRGDRTVAEAVLQWMAREGRVRMDPRGVALPGQGPKLSRGEQQRLSEILEIYRAAEFQPPTVAEVKSQATRNQAAVPQLVELAVAQGELVKISPDIYLHADVERRMRQVLSDRMAGGNGLTVSQIRETLSTTRKYAVPLCEYLDHIGFTERRGDLRPTACALCRSGSFYRCPRRPLAVAVKRGTTGGKLPPPLAETNPEVHTGLVSGGLWAKRNSGIQRSLP